ncbi:MAG: hypothetical protein AAGG46_03170 [Planctomycetota bacterium]
MSNRSKAPTIDRSGKRRLRVIPPSAFGLPPSGISVTEVLIAMGVLSVGLLGVAAIFPVGGYYMQRGDVSDNADAIAQAALNDAITRGLLDPENWVAYEDTFAANGIKGWFPSYTQLGVPGTMTRPFAADFRQRLNFSAQKQAGLIGQAWDAIEASKRLQNTVGSVFVLDPLAIAAHTATDLTATPPVFSVLTRATAFPASGGVTGAMLPDFRGSVVSMNPSLWTPWENPQGGWPLQRLTVASRQPNSSVGAEPMLFVEADRVASALDDLAIDLPDQDDQPTRQRFTRSGGTPLARQARQEYSYLFTVAPTTYDAFRSLANGGDGSFDVAAVAFHKRLVGARGVTPAAQTAQRNAELALLQSGERLVRASIQTAGAGAGGGEVLFFRGDGDGNAGGGSAVPANADNWWLDSLGDESPPWDDLRVGQWVFLFGPNTQSTNERPLLFAQWYRVLAIDDTEAENADKARLRVSLRGPDWPWTNTTNVDGDFTPTATEGNLFAVIVPDVVAVHTRTLNLQAGAVWGE